jgi:hypothetical protein
VFGFVSGHDFSRAAQEAKRIELQPLQELLSVDDLEQCTGFLGQGKQVRRSRYFHQSECVPQSEKKRRGSSPDFG